MKIDKGVKGFAIKKEGLDKGDDFREKEIKISFKDLDYAQGQTFTKWATEGLLEEIINKFKHYTALKYKNAFNKKFKTYDFFPTKTKFKRPAHIPQDALWASMHIGSQPCIIGHFVQNYFFIVHLDIEHHLYISEKKHT